MCGICGKIYTDTSIKIDNSELKRMSDSMVHRGPDDEGFYINNNVGLGFRRLSIIDLSTGHQPLSNEDDTIWIIFNGEIYNFQELRDGLEKQGHKFKTKTDTEVIIHLYEQYGRRCVEYLRGMFGFAIWDDKKKKLFCARDRFGIKPFYYYLKDNQFVFASELKGITSAQNINTEINLTALDDYFTYGYILNNRSIYKHIKKLQPGHTLEFYPVDKKLDINRYWDINFEPDYSKTEEQWCEELDALLSEAVKLRLIADVPLGAFLSGGIDSSSVVALMSKYSTGPVKTFSIGFKEQKYNELQYAREIAEKYNTEHHETILEPESVSLLPKLVHAYDEPFADSSAIPTYYVSKFARENVTVALSGDGGDELFAGYDSYSDLKKFHNYHRAPDFLNKMFWGTIHSLMPFRVKGKGFAYRLSKNRNNVAAYYTTFTQPERELLFNREVWQRLNLSQFSEINKELIISRSNTKDFISRMQELDMRTYLVDDILTKVDRVSMLNSLEVRVPILDHKVAELTFKIPSKFKLNGSDKKYIFKKTMSKYLTPNILNHRKQGFTVPLKVWFKNDLNEYISDRLLSNNGHLSDYLNKNFVAEVVRGNESGSREVHSKLWHLLFFDAWLEQNKVKS